MNRSCPIHVLTLALALLSMPKLGLCATLSAPVNGSLIPLPDGQVLCGDATGGWIPDPSGTKIRPPLDATLIGKATSIRVASSAAACAASKDADVFVVSGPIPAIDRRTVDLWIDEGHLDVRGSNLDGSRLEWEIKGEHGSDVCVASSTTGGQQSCSYSISKTLPADTSALTLRVLPAGAPGKGAIFDNTGQLVAQDSLSVTPSRTIVASALTTERHIDLSTGEAHLPLSRPKAVASVDCDSGRCELSDGEVHVRSIAGVARTLNLRLRLTPRVYVRSGDTFVQTVNIPLDITYCPITLASPPALRDTDDVRVVVRVDSKCATNDATLRWMANGNNVPVIASESKDNFIYMLLGLGRISGEKVTIAAMRGSSDSSVIGLVSMTTSGPPQLRVSLHLKGYGEIDFIPTNRNVIVSTTAANLRGRIVTLPVEGAYEVKVQDGHTEIRGIAGGGYALLRFALRDESLPGHLAQTDLAHFTGYVQRAMREVNVPAPIGDTASKAPIVEVVCTDAAGHSLKVVPGVPLHVPFEQRDGCRLMVYPNRIPEEDGEQRLDVDIEVTSVGGSSRSDGHFTQRLILSHGAEPRIFWIHGVKSQFDRITVQLTHVTEESQYVRGRAGHLDVPSAKWTIVAENTRWRFYATVSVPVQLFRFSNDPNGAGTGPLSLNLGVLSRFTWVTREGTEGILGLEGGVMGMGLAADNTRQLNIVGGLGIGVPLGNVGQPTQASINIHAWAAYRLGNEFAPALDSTGAVVVGQTVALNHWSFIFGPSVTFGNVGFDM
jgi:hypothetical protein